MNIHLGYPQLILIILTICGLIIVAGKDGQEKEGRYSFLVTLTSDCIVFLLLWWGGFFG